MIPPSPLRDCLMRCEKSYEWAAAWRICDKIQNACCDKIWWSILFYTYESPKTKHYYISRSGSNEGYEFNCHGTSDFLIRESDKMFYYMTAYVTSFIDSWEHLMWLLTLKLWWCSFKGWFSSLQCGILTRDCCMIIFLATSWIKYSTWDATHLIKLDLLVRLIWLNL